MLPCRCCAERETYELQDSAARESHLTRNSAKWTALGARARSDLSLLSASSSSGGIKVAAGSRRGEGSEETTRRMTTTTTTRSGDQHHRRAAARSTECASGWAVSRAFGESAKRGTPNFGQSTRTQVEAESRKRKVECEIEATHCVDRIRELPELGRGMGSHVSTSAFEFVRV